MMSNTGSWIGGVRLHINIWKHKYFMQALCIQTCITSDNIGYPIQMNLSPSHTYTHWWWQNIWTCLSSLYWFEFVFKSIFNVEFKLDNGTNLSNNQSSYKFSYSAKYYLLEHRKISYPAIYIFICLFFHFDLKKLIKYTAILPKFFTLFMKAIFPVLTLVLLRSGTWTLDLSHDPIWAIWLAEIGKFHQHHDRILHLMVLSNPWSLLTIQCWFNKSLLAIEGHVNNGCT